MVVTPRHLALAIATFAVFGVGVYLFFEVRSVPAQASASSPPPAPVHEAAGPAAPTTPHDALPTRVRPTVQAPAAPTAASEEPQQPDEPLSFDPAAPLRPNTKLDAVMDQANKAYDRQDFEEARLIAGKVLQKQPTNVRMLRIMVSATCIEGDNAAAQKYFEQLPKQDREQMKTRCDRYGVTFKDPSQ